jgi:hypothetical protein
MRKLTPEEEEDERYLRAVENAELDPEAENYPRVMWPKDIGEGPEDEKFCSPYGTIWTRREAREYFRRCGHRGLTDEELRTMVPDHKRGDHMKDDLPFEDPPEGMDHETWHQHLLERAAQYPPLAGANLDHGPDDEKFNAGDGCILTRGMARRERQRKEYDRRMEGIRWEMLAEEEAARRADPGSAP